MTSSHKFIVPVQWLSTIGPEFILLYTLFEVKFGAVFTAIIKGCD